MHFAPVWINHNNDAILNKNKEKRIYHRICLFTNGRGRGGVTGM